LHSVLTSDRWTLFRYQVPPIFAEPITGPATSGRARSLNPG
jgi:hypothetical protein